MATNPASPLDQSNVKGAVPPVALTVALPSFPGTQLASVGVTEAEILEGSKIS